MAHVRLDELEALQHRREKYDQWVEMRNYMGISTNLIFVFVQFRCAPDTFHVHVKTGNAIVVETGEYIHMSDMYGYDCHYTVENKYNLDMGPVMCEWAKKEFI